MELGLIFMESWEEYQGPATQKPELNQHRDTEEQAIEARTAWRSTTTTVNQQHGLQVYWCTSKLSASVLIVSSHSKLF